jgi:hypothetical protein
MNATLSTRQLRLVGLLVLVVVCAGAYWVLVRHRAAPTTASSTPAATQPAQTTATTTTPVPSRPHHALTPAAAAVRGLPTPVVRALRTHRVVVVSLSAPQASLDQLASAEAQAGAAAAGAGFVNLDVLRQRQGSPVLHAVGLVDTPAVLVVERRGIYAEFKGFVDRQVVEQAVVDARG